ncbi:MAG: hypothetical protein AAF810_17760 [Cyanobacteria bacterium P01_D01_bin.36]
MSELNQVELEIKELKMQLSGLREAIADVIDQGNRISAKVSKQNQELLEKLNSIAGHIVVNPDGDCWRQGKEAAELLKKMGCNVHNARHLRELATVSGIIPSDDYYIRGGGTQGVPYVYNVTACCELLKK